MPGIRCLPSKHGIEELSDFLCFSFNDYYRILPAISVSSVLHFPALFYRRRSRPGRLRDTTVLKHLPFKADSTRAIEREKRIMWARQHTFFFPKPSRTRTPSHLVLVLMVTLANRWQQEFTSRYYSLCNPVQPFLRSKRPDNVPIKWVKKIDEKVAKWKTLSKKPGQNLH